jgi:hypothetical protein
LVASLLVARATFAEVIESGEFEWQVGGGGSVDGDFEFSLAWSNSTGTVPGSWAGAQGRKRLEAAEVGIYECSYTLCASAQASVRWYSGQYGAAQADAYACIDGYVPYWDSCSASIQVSGSHSGGFLLDLPDGPDWAWGSWVAALGPGYHVEGFHYSVAATTVASSSSDTASAAASATASIDMNQLQ